MVVLPEVDFIVADKYCYIVFLNVSIKVVSQQQYGVATEKIPMLLLVIQC